MNLDLDSDIAAAADELERLKEAGWDSAEAAITSSIGQAEADYRAALARHTGTGVTAASVETWVKRTARVVGADMQVAPHGGFFLEHGTSRQPPRPYMTAAASRAYRGLAERIGDGIGDR